MFDGQISDAHWQRFEIYARRIHELTWESPREPIHPFVFSELLFQSRLRSQVLFPSLVTLHVAPPSPMSAQLLVFLGPSLAHMSIRFTQMTGLSINRDDEYAFGRLLRCIYVEAPSFSDLDIDMSVTRDITPLLHSITTLLHLKKLTMKSSISVGSLVATCGCLPALDYLSLGYVDFLPQFAPRTAFPSLAQLRIEGITAVTLEALLRCISSPNLHELSITSIFPGPESLPSCFEYLGKAFTNSLRTLCIEWTSDGTVTSFGPLLHPLLSLRGLQWVELRFHRAPVAGLDVTAQHVRDMASSWPELRYLWLNLGGEERGPSAYDLVHFARGCPKLWSLDIGLVNFHEAEPFPENMPPLQSSLSMRELTLQDYDDLGCDVDVDALAVFLHTIFPNLDLAYLEGFFPAEGRLVPALRDLRDGEATASELTTSQLADISM